MWLDWVCVVIVLISTVIAVFRGFVREAVSLSTWVLALLLSFHYARVAGAYLGSFVQSSTAQYAIGFLLVFFIIMIIGILFGFLIKMLISSTGLGFLDMILGGLFGIIRGICIVVLGIVFLSMPWIGMQSVVSESTIAQDLQPIIMWGEHYVPSEDSIMSKVHNYMPGSSNTGYLSN
jgi:membrane protein required for colicin V production